MQSTLDAGPVIRVELTGAFVDVVDLGPRDFGFPQANLMIHKTGSWDSP